MSDFTFCHVVLTAASCGVECNDEKGYQNDGINPVEIKLGHLRLLAFKAFLFVR
jgi:hypothetical protein